MTTVAVFRGEEVIQRSVQSTTKQDWLRDNTKNQETFHKVGEMISLFSRKLKKEAEPCNVQVVDTSDDFQSKIAEALEYLSNS